jgi:hypothetical protein
VAARDSRATHRPRQVSTLTFRPCSLQVAMGTTPGDSALLARTPIECVSKIAPQMSVAAPFVPIAGLSNDSAVVRFPPSPKQPLEGLKHICKQLRLNTLPLWSIFRRSDECDEPRRVHEPFGLGIDGCSPQCVPAHEQGNQPQLARSCRQGDARATERARRNGRTSWSWVVTNHLPVRAWSTPRIVPSGRSMNT